jgi:dCMP deaminase
MRITRPQMFMEIAHVVSRRSTCCRLNVGAVIVHDRSIISIGYNGRPSGAPHCEGNDCVGRSGCHEAIHAEANALSRIAGNVLGDFELYTTDSPCVDCAEHITWRLSAGHRIRRVFYDRPYRLRDGIDHLINLNIPVYRITPAGYIIDEESGNIMTAEDIDA